MWSRAAISTISLLVLVACSNAEQQPEKPNLDALTSRAVAKLQQTMTERKIPGAAFAVVVDGKLALSEALGVREVGKPDPVTTGSRFVVASLTKTVTAAAVLSARDDGKLSLEAPISDLVPLELANGASAASINLHQLLSNQSGLLDWNGITYAYPTCGQSLSSYFSEHPPVQGVAAGKVWIYSSAGFSLAGRALEAADGRSYAEAVASRVFEPAGMTRATFDIATFLGDDHVALHVAGSDGQPTPKALDLCPAWLPSGHLFATVEDIAHFEEVLLREGKPILSSDSFARMTQRQISDGLTDEYYGYGLWIEHNKLERWTHSGRWTGNRSCMMVVPSKNFAAVLMLNADAVSACDPLGELLDIYLGLEDVPPPSYHSDPTTWDGLVGSYHDPLFFGDMSVKRDASGNLVASFSNVPKLPASDHPLGPFDTNIFDIDYGTTHTNLVFWRDPTQKAEYAVFGIQPTYAVFARTGE